LIHLKYDEVGIFDETLAKYKHALEKLSSFGIRIPESSRLRTYQKRTETILKQPGNLLLVLQDDSDKMIFDFREMDELIFIINSFTNEPTAQELERLRLLPGGTENPDDETSTKARDAQFELFLRAMFVQAKFCIEMGAPDLLLSDGQITFQIEAKRPGSHRRFDDRLRDAINQLQRQKNWGIVAISLDHVIRPPGRYLVVGEHKYLAEAVAGLLHKYVMENLRNIGNRLIGKSYMSALLFTLRIPAKVQDTNLTLLGSNVHTLPVSEEDQPGYEVVKALLNILEGVRI
jgi:hypothetical protein